MDKLRDYVKGLTKKVKANLVYPEDTRQGQLAGALKTLRASVPFAQPPEQMTVTIAIAVGFGNKR